MTADTTPLDHPWRCPCGGKGCDCPCHTPTRDNTVSDDDLELDRLKAERDEAVRLLEAERTERQRAEIERDVARGELAATKAGADHLQTSLARARAELAEALAKLGGGR